MNKQELEDAIYELENKPQTYQTVEKLAHLYSVYNELYNNSIPYTKQAEKQPTMAISGDSELILLLNNKGIEKALPIIIELIEVVQVTNPKLYNGFIRKIDDL